MFTPFDTAHMTHRADRHVPADAASREANRQLRETRRAAVRSVLLRAVRRVALRFQTARQRGS